MATDKAANIGTTKRVTIVTDVRICVEPPSYLGRWIRKPYGTPGYWHDLAKEYQGWVNEFHEFLRDHRSQDASMMNVERVESVVCAVCGETWETDRYDKDDHCAYCGAVLEE